MVVPLSASSWLLLPFRFQLLSEPVSVSVPPLFRSIVELRLLTPMPFAVTPVSVRARVSLPALPMRVPLAPVSLLDRSAVSTEVKVISMLSSALAIEPTALLSKEAFLPSVFTVSLLPAPAFTVETFEKLISADLSALLPVTSKVSSTSVPTSVPLARFAPFTFVKV